MVVKQPTSPLHFLFNFLTLLTVVCEILNKPETDTEAETAAGPAFTLGFTLFCVTLLLNIVALRVVRKYREMYD